MIEIDLEPHTRTVLGEHGWYACEFPERAYDYSLTWFEQRCRSCLVMLNAVVRQQPGLRLWDYATNQRGLALDFYNQWGEAVGLPRLEHVV